MSGFSVNHSGWIVSMDGKEAMRTGGTTPFAMTVTGRTATDTSSQGVTTSREMTGRTDIDSGAIAGWREFYQMETEELLARWHVLLNEPGNAIALRDVLQERLNVLHRLNELGTRAIDGLSIFTALEATNASMRKIDRAGAA